MNKKSFVRQTIKICKFSFYRRNNQIWIHTVCTLLQNQINTIKNREDYDQSRRTYGYPCHTNGRNNINGILLLFGKKITPCYKKGQLHFRFF